MNKHDPLLERINEKQREINEENRLNRKKKKFNWFSLGTSILLFVGILITIIRTLSVVLK